jgi:hypothetical protein
MGNTVLVVDGKMLVKIPLGEEVMMVALTDITDGVRQEFFLLPLRGLDIVGSCSNVA